MCGITGWISFDRDLTREQGVVDAMTQTMACRGPDASGTWVEGPAAPGSSHLPTIVVSHVRLADAQTKGLFWGE